MRIDVPGTGRAARMVALLRAAVGSATTRPPSALLLPEVLDAPTGAAARMEDALPGGARRIDVLAGGAARMFPLSRAGSGTAIFEAEVARWAPSA
jgi:hypothetical protein